MSGGDLFADCRGVPTGFRARPHAQQTNHHSMMGSINDPKDGKAAAKTVFTAVLVYVVRPSSLDLRGSSPQLRFFHVPMDSRKTMGWHGGLTIGPVRTQVFLVFCGSQAYLHSRQRNPGNIALS